MGALILFIPLLALFLVRFTDLSIKGSKSICLMCFNEEIGEWTFNGWEKYRLSSTDGPYVFRGKNTTTVLSVVESADHGYELVSEEFDPDPDKVFKTKPLNPKLEPFSFKLKPRPFRVDSVTYQNNAPLVAVADIEGNFDAFYSFLHANGVIDTDYNWIFGEGHLVLNGDFVDRGAEVTQLLWLIYKLETEALESGGAVHFILGNHEAMNLQHDVRYWHHKYRALAQQFADTLNYKAASSSLIRPENEIVDWLYSKNVLAKIGNILFVHAGISPALLQSDLSLSEINAVAKSNIDTQVFGNADVDPDAKLVMGRLGPLWYRGLAMGYKDYYKKATPDFVADACAKYGVDHIAIGHSIAPDISFDYSKKVIRIDVHHGDSLGAPSTRGIRIENGQIFKIDAAGGKSTPQNLSDLED